MSEALDYKSEHRALTRRRLARGFVAGRVMTASLMIIASLGVLPVAEELVQVVATSALIAFLVAGGFWVYFRPE